MKLTYFSKKGSYVLLSTLLLIASCRNDKNSAEIKDNGLPKAKEKITNTIAYIEIDTLMNQYQFCKDNMLRITQKSESYKRQLNNKSQALQRAAEEFQQKIQQGKFTSQQQAEQAQASLQKMQIDLQKMQEKLSEQFDKEQQQYNNQLRDSIKNFLKEYNKDKRYTMIISKAGDNILMADPSLDITKDVINGLNKRYKKK